MARAHDEKDDAAAERKAQSLEATVGNASDNDEEAIRAKLRESGWEKKKRSDRDLPTSPSSGRKHSTDDAAVHGDSSSKKEGDGGRESRRRGSGHARSRRSRSHRRDRDRDDRRDRDRESRRRRDRSAKRGKPSSRRRSRSDSKSRSRSVSQSRTKRSSHRRRGASPSRSASRGKESSSKRSRRVSKSRSPSLSRKKKVDDAESDSDPDGKELTRRSKSVDKDQVRKKEGAEREADAGDAMEVDEEGVGKKAAEESEKGKDSGTPSSQRKGRKSSRRSRSKSRSPSRSSRRRRHRSRSRSPSRSRRRRSSRSRSRSRGRRNRDHDRRRRRSRSRSRSNSRRRRRSSSKDKKRRDANSSPEPHEHPPGVPAPPVATVVNPTITQLMQQYPTMSLQDIIAKMQASNVTMAAAVAMKPARELYVGNLPPNVTAPQLQEFLGTIIQQVGLSLQPGNPILNTWISTDGHFAFCEMRSVEECNLALLLNQLSLLGQPLKFGRPRSFMGPPQPMPAVSSRTQTALVNLGCTPNPVWFASPTLGVPTLGGAPPLPTALPAASLPGSLLAQTVVASSLPTTSPSVALGALPSDPNAKRLLMANIPVVLTEDQVKELVQPFGDLKSFTLVKDTVTGASTGNALFEYQDDSVADEALQGLDGLDIGGIPLSVRRAPQDANGLAPVDETSVVVKLANMVSVDELQDDEEFGDLKEDVEEECKRFGAVVAMEIPRPQGGEQPPGVGNIYVHFNEKSEAASALKALSGRKFGGNIVQVTYYPLAKFESKEFA